MTRVRKDVLPVAGLVKRVLQATKAQPKEMLPVADKPLIQYAVEEAVASGFTEMVFISEHLYVAAGADGARQSDATC